MVTFALALPVLILFASFVIDVGNWFEHQRHLQLQADAGALAAAGDVRYPCTQSDDEAIERRAKEYSGTLSASGGYNHQIGGTAFNNVNFALNSASYPGGSPKVDPNPVVGSPCQTGTIDVKLTETDLPLFLKVAGLFSNVEFINAHARVQIFEKEDVNGALPVAVPDPNPQKARAYFIDEEHEDRVLGSQPLDSHGSEKVGLEKLAIWSNEAEPFPLKVASGKIGVRIALSGSTSTSCGDPLVECYDAGSAGGIVFASGYSMAGSGAQPGPPQARGAYFEAGTCRDPYFSPGGCSVGLHAKVDFGPCEGVETKVGARLNALAGGKKYTMTLKGCSGASTSEWATSEAIPIPAEAGPVPISLEWVETKGKEGGNECKERGGNKCFGEFKEVQRSFAASNARSGPIRLAEIREGGTTWANSFERCSAVKSECTYRVAVRVGIKQNLEENAADVNSPPVALRVFHEAENNPSQNQSLDCEPPKSLGGITSNLREEIALGCAPQYTRNLGDACPTHSTELWSSQQPWDCTAIQTGGAVNQVYQGMNKRILGMEEPKKGECTHPNEWSKYPNLNYGTDPRIVPVFLTPFGSFSGSGGNETVPVTNFATFYVTGWAGQGKEGQTSQSICPGDEKAESGTIVGHFIKYVDVLNEGHASEEMCNFESLTPCEAVMTE